MRSDRTNAGVTRIGEILEDLVVEHCGIDPTHVSLRITAYADRIVVRPIPRTGADDVTFR